MGRDDALHFPADVVIVDECGQASLAEIAIPSYTFHKTAARTMYGGDPEQFSALLTSTTANEVAPLVSRSTLRDMLQVSRLRLSPPGHAVSLRLVNLPLVK